MIRANKPGKPIVEGLFFYTDVFGKPAHEMVSFDLATKDDVERFNSLLATSSCFSDMRNHTLLLDLISVIDPNDCESIKSVTYLSLTSKDDSFYSLFNFNERKRIITELAAKLDLSNKDIVADLDYFSDLYDSGLLDEGSLLSEIEYEFINIKAEDIIEHGELLIELGKGNVVRNGYKKLMDVFAKYGVFDNNPILLEELAEEYMTVVEWGNGDSSFLTSLRSALNTSGLELCEDACDVLVTAAIESINVSNARSLILSNLLDTSSELFEELCSHIFKSALDDGFAGRETEATEAAQMVEHLIKTNRIKLASEINGTDPFGL